MLLGLVNDIATKYDTEFSLTWKHFSDIAERGLSS